MVVELWRDIPGFEAKYRVSNLGRVLSVERVVGNKNIKETILRTTIAKNGYERVSLTTTQRNHKMFSVHRLVSEAFIPFDEKENLQVNHIDGNKTNNRFDNLEWVTPKQNIEHAVTTGLFDSLSGERSHLSSYTEDKILNVIELLKKDLGPSEVSRITGVDRAVCSKINNGTSWKRFSVNYVNSYPICKKRCLNQFKAVKIE